MAVTKLARVAVAPWAITDVCNALKTSFIDAGLMTDWYDSFSAGGYEHRVLEMTYNAAKTYGKTYYWFTFNGVGIWVRTSTGWNATSHIPSGAGGVAGTASVDWFNTNTSALDGASQITTLSTSISFSVTSYTSGGRAFFVVRTGTIYNTFTIDPAGTTFRTFFDLNLGYHSGIYTIGCNGRRIMIYAINRNRRELLLGSSLNIGNDGQGQSVTVSMFSIPVNFGNYGGFYGSAAIFPVDGFVLPGWTTAANPSAGSNFNPVFTGIRLTSAHASDLPSDFGISSVKNSDVLAIQDNATVTAGSEEYEIIQFSNQGTNNGITSNPVFLARTI